MVLRIGDQRKALALLNASQAQTPMISRHRNPINARTIYARSLPAYLLQ